MIGFAFGRWADLDYWTQASPPPIAQLAPALPAAIPFATSFQHLTSDDLAAATLLPDIPNGARFAWIQAVGRDLRWRNDETPPMTAVGMLIHAGSTFKYDLVDGPIRVIRTEAGAEANVWYERGDSF